MGYWDEFKADLSKAEDVLWDVATAKPIRDAVADSKPGQAVQEFASEAKDAAKSALKWAPWIVGGVVVIGAAFVLGPYVLPFVRAWGKE